VRTPTTATQKIAQLLKRIEELESGDLVRDNAFLRQRVKELEEALWKT